jgi:hypothetical protein
MGQGALKGIFLAIDRRADEETPDLLAYLPEKSGS